MGTGLKRSFVTTQKSYSVCKRYIQVHPVAFVKVHNAYSSRFYKCLANAKRPCDCRVLCLRLKSSLCSCAHSISDMTAFGCCDQGRDSVRPVL